MTDSRQDEQAKRGAAEAAPGVFLVDVFVVRRITAGWEALVMRRASGRSPGSWEAVHGHVEPGERPDEAAWREVIEETGITPVRLYNLSRVESFYLHRKGMVAVVPAFAAVVEARTVTLSQEHDAWEWLPLPDARERFSWPRCRRALDDLPTLLGDPAIEDVLRVR